ncbi:glycoside hydrolase family protein [Rhodopirellula sallentina]|uniref:beta-fructofuranosidase n=1 Tax=Rhodopirellula sallentina SM41 TaxID=1263870 RepID=M5U1T6_9BACT|nr:glycosyl hydrolase family 32 protein [Rhodopirellula sallentina]EMI55400.1 glycosyl hydrolase family 32 protein [Rhodopirellula sallentina SM41]
MFTEIDGSRKAIGDVDVLYHDGLYHLFHLVLPNHDFIAHAVSTDALNWRRVNNALFIGDPGSWDDLMLWTMHVSPDPHQPGRWRMFYTGLSRRDQGNYQRIGMAVSDDLMHWTKSPVHWVDRRGANDPERVKEALKLSRSLVTPSEDAPLDENSCFPLEPDPQYYEASLEEGRHWISFRDPYFYHDGENGWLMASARVNHGPIVRRGCVALMKEVEPNHFQAMPPLHHPRLYDDIEVPNLIRFEDDHYLIGSIREDAKIRYWHTDHIRERWQSYHDNVLLAQGNYAGRVCRDEQGWLLWNFYSMSSTDRVSNNIMPPPKRLCRDDDGLLRAVSFEGIDEYIIDSIDAECVHGLIEDLDDAGERCICGDGKLEIACESGFQAFVFDGVMECFRFSANLCLQGLGKCGLVFRVDPETRDGYYLSLDLYKGVAQLRGWGTNGESSGEHMMQFDALQSGFWHGKARGEAHVSLTAFGSYIELSIDGRVVLSLADHRFSSGHLGVYLETAVLCLSDIDIVRLRSPSQTDEHLTSG